MGARTLEQINAEIAHTKAQIESVRGDETEVYARIVGYYRAVRNWNKGKRDEFAHRTLFEPERFSGCRATATDDSPALSGAADKEREKSVEQARLSISRENISASSWRYELFTRPGCPHCPPVADFMAHSKITGNSINVDTDEGMSLAAERGVFSTPTVIFYNESGASFARAHNVDELSACLNCAS